MVLEQPQVLAQELEPLLELLEWPLEPVVKVLELVQQQ